MATAAPEEVNKYLSCAICFEHFKEPKVLPCLHTYCKECLVKLVKKQGSDHVIFCPACREDTKVSKLFLKVVQLNMSITALFHIALVHYVNSGADLRGVRSNLPKNLSKNYKISKTG